MRTVTRRLFDLGAAYYDVVTARLREWREDCGMLATHLEEGTGQVLDLGTGPGVSAYEVARSIPTASVLGLDISHPMLRRALRNLSRYPDTEGRARFAQGDARALPLQTASVDAVTTHSFLYLVRDRRTVLDEIRRVLRPSGVAVLFEPRRERPAVPPFRIWIRRPVFAWTMVLWGVVARLHGTFREGELGALVSEAGMTVRRVRPALDGYGWLVVATVADRAVTVPRHR